jgi:hypothetical protein
LEGVFEQYLENPEALAENDPQPATQTRQSSPRAERMSSGLEKSTCYSSNQVPERLPEVEYQDDGLKSQVPTGFSDFDPDSSISTQMEEPTSSPSEPVLESGLTEEQTKFVRKWLQDWHATLEYERRRAETRRWMTEEWSTQISGARTKQVVERSS